MRFQIINSAANPPFTDMTDGNILVVIHNAGFFSCSSIALQDIMIYYKEHGKLPDVVDRTRQYDNYKLNATQDLIPFYFEEKPEIQIPIETGGRDGWDFVFGFPIRITKQNNIDPQYSDYKQLDFESLKPFVEKFFTPSEGVDFWVNYLSEGNEIDFENTCAVFYRGNDKSRETEIAPYEKFIAQGEWLRQKHIHETGNDLRFLVMPDEAEFMIAFKEFHPRSFTFHELPAMKKKDSANFLEMPLAERAEYGKKFFAAILIMSKCKHLITHSGNGGLWSVIYRGNAENIYQWNKDKFI